MGFGVLAFGENCSEIYRATHRLSAAKNVAPTVLVILVLQGYSLVSTREEVSNQ